MGVKKDAAASEDVFPIGISDFEKLISNGMVYIDKTSYLEKLLNPGIGVALMLRPRRFGKTLTMSMLSCFLEMNYQHPEDRSRPERLFKDLAIYKNKAFCDKHMGRYPVISLSFKEVEGDTFEDAVEMIVAIFAELAAKFEFLTKKKELDTVFLRRIKDCNHGIIPVFKPDGTFARTIASLIKFFVKNLTNCLKEVFNQDPVIIIDEYDVPLQKATAGGYYDKMLKVIRGILSASLKDNNANIHKGFVTGCLRIAHQSIFTGINNFKANSIHDEFLSGFIGLTKDETEKLLRQHGMTNRLQDAVEWYDGYCFGGTDMLCPWSVLNFTEDALNSSNPASFQPQNYWANSSGNDIIELCMKHPRPQDAERLQHLLEGKTEEIILREFTSYPAITSDTDFDTFATLMLHTGYLTVAGDAVPSARNRAVVRIPNKEVLECFSDKLEPLFSKSNPEWLDKALKITGAFFAGEADKASDIIEDMLVSFISIRDTGYEYFYHGFMLGILSMTITNRMSMESNRESGNGFSDIIIKNSKTGKAVILEFKKCDRDTPLETEKVCREALKQIEINRYDHDLKKDYPEVLKYGIAFVKKGCRVIKA